MFNGGLQEPWPGWCRHQLRTPVGGAAGLADSVSTLTTLRRLRLADFAVVTADIRQSLLAATVLMSWDVDRPRWRMATTAECARSKKFVLIRVPFRSPQ